jgi:hypothetical protein
MNANIPKSHLPSSAFAEAMADKAEIERVGCLSSFVPTGLQGMNQMPFQALHARKVSCRSYGTPNRVANS